MKLRLLPLALIALLLLAFGASAACGGDSEESLALEEYFRQLEALNDTADERAVELQEAYDAERAAAASDEEVLAALEDFFKNTQLIFTTFADGSSDLIPPAVVEELHIELVVGSVELAASLEDMLNGLGDLDSAADLEGLLEESGLSQAEDRFAETCATLQDTADRNEIDVDLDCAD